MQGLRLHDNPALLAAVPGADYLYPIFILDPVFLNPDRSEVSWLYPPKPGRSRLDHFPCFNGPWLVLGLSLAQLLTALSTSRKHSEDSLPAG